MRRWGNKWIPQSEWERIEEQRKSDEEVKQELLRELQRASRSLEGAHGVLRRAQSRYDRDRQRDARLANNYEVVDAVTKVEEKQLDFNLARKNFDEASSGPQPVFALPDIRLLDPEPRLTTK